MKKQFFYAAMAITFMASCTSDDTVAVDPVNPTPEESRVAIELGVNTPNIKVSSRGTGTVGSVAGESEDIGWNNQALKIVMVDENGGKAQEETETGTEYIFEGLTFNAPYSNATDKNIRIYVSEGLFQHKYYPVTGKFDFYGYHVDGLTCTETITAKTDTDPAVATVTAINIDGSQDILAAQTIDIPAEEGTAQTNAYYDVITNNPNINWSEMAQNQFSARTARNKIVPILDFKHQLARLKFYVRAGSEATASKSYDNGAWTDKNKTADPSDPNYELSNGAVYVTKIAALHMTKSIAINLAGTNGPTTTADEATTYGPFELKSKDPSVQSTELSELIALIPTAPEYDWSNETAIAALNNYKGTPVGEALMFLPDANIASYTDDTTAPTNATDTEIVLSIDLAQYLPDTEEEDDADGDGITGETTFILKEQKNQLISLPASKIVGSTTQTGEPTSFKFMPGESYNVYITIYGMERIVVSAELTDWVNGGDVDLDIEDDKY